MIGTSQEHLLKDCFGGEFSNLLTAEGGRSSQRPEPFYFVSVEVGNGKDRLEASLADFVRGESVDYSWEEKGSSGQKSSLSLPTIKKTLIDVLPPHLIFHLRRFDFDFETCRLVKKNDRFEFPLRLNMLPYTTAADDPSVRPEDYVYELSGVVTHIGTAESG